MLKLIVLFLALLFSAVAQVGITAAIASESGETRPSETTGTLIPTQVDLDRFPNEIIPGQNFTVSGIVSIHQSMSVDGDNNAKSKSTLVPALTVGIYIGPSTLSPEFSTSYYVVKIGEAITGPDGTFAAAARTPPVDGVVVPLGDFFLTAKVESSGDLLSSWSPRYHILLKSQTILKLDVYKEGAFLIVLGKLQDDTGNPVSAVPVKILLNDHNAGVISTGFDGSYETRISLPSNDYTRPVRVSSIFSGTQKYQPISVTQDLELSSTTASLGTFNVSSLTQSLPAFGAGVGLGLGAALGLAFVIMKKPTMSQSRRRESAVQSSAVEQPQMAQLGQVPEITENERAKRAIDALAKSPAVDAVRGAYGEVRRYLASTLLPESKSMTPRELLELINQKTPQFSQLMVNLTVIFENVNYKRQDSAEIDSQSALDLARKILDT